MNMWAKMCNPYHGVTFCSVYMQSKLFLPPVKDRSLETNGSNNPGSVEEATEAASIYIQLSKTWHHITPETFVHPHLSHAGLNGKSSDSISLRPRDLFQILWVERRVHLSS